MPRCEDFPCCGHASGDCPSVDSRGRERYRCVECGKLLRAGAASSICPRCTKRLETAWSNGDDFDYSMNG